MSLRTNISNTFENTTVSDAELISISPWLIATGILICSWVILANSVVFLCLVTSPKTKKISMFIQLLSLSFTDMHVGLCMIPMFLTQSTALNSNVRACAITIYVYFVSQGATLYHTLLVCIHRLINMKQKSNAKQENFNATLVQISLIWIGCLIFFGIPFPVLIKPSGDVQACSLPVIFGQNYIFATPLWGALLILPFSCVNILYVYLLAYLRARLKDIHVRTAHITRTHSLELSNIGKRNKKFEFDHNGLTPVVNKVETKLNASTHAVVKSVGILGQEPGTSKNLSEQKCRTIHVKQANTHAMNEAHSAQGTEQNMNRQDERIFKGYSIKETDLCRQRINVMGTNNSRLGLKTLRRVLVTVGIILTSLDVCMAPLVFFAFFENVNVGYVNRSIRLLCLMMATMNSALNPVINVSMIKPFRQILFEKAKKLFRSLDCR